MSVISIEQLLAQTKAPLIPIVIDAVEGAESHTDSYRDWETWRRDFLFRLFLLS